MDIIEDIGGGKKEIISCIKKYGSVREHNYWFFYNQQTDYTKLFFFKFKDGGILSIRYKSGIWELIGEVIAPEKKRLEMFNEFLNYVLSTKKDKKLFMFVPEKFFNNINGTLQRSNKYNITGKPDIYYTPIFDLEKWDETLEGKEFKKLRNIKNKFLRSYKVEFVPPNEVKKEKLIEVVNKWRKNRPKIERNYYTEMYIKFIKDDFKGADMSSVMVVNKEPCCITAGWKIPNTNNFYSAIGLYDYRYDGMGEVANINDLVQIKKAGYKCADFGDSTESLLKFKKKFGPNHFYKTYWFHIARK